MGKMKESKTILNSVEAITDFAREGSLIKRKESSKRTSFQLSKKTHEYICLYAKRINVDAKTLISEQIIYWIALAENFIALSGVSSDIDMEKHWYDLVKEQKQVSSVRKTYVLSEKALKLLNEKSHKFNVSRDKLVERIINLGISHSENFFKNRNETYSKICEEHKKVYADYNKNVGELTKTLNKDDPLRIRCQYMLGFMEKLMTDINKSVSQGIEIDPTDF